MVTYIYVTGTLSISASPIILHLTLLQHPRWYVLALTITTHYCNICYPALYPSNFYYSPLILHLMFWISLNDMRMRLLFLSVSALYLILQWHPLLVVFLYLYSMWTFLIKLYVLDRHFLLLPDTTFFSVLCFNHILLLLLLFCSIWPFLRQTQWSR